LVHVWEINSQQREVPEAATARIDLRIKLLARLDWLLVDEPEYDNLDDLCDLEGWVGLVVS
jgi:hypothetical protein